MLPKRFWDKVEKTPTCWNWVAANGTGHIGILSTDVEKDIARSNLINIFHAWGDLKGHNTYIVSTAIVKVDVYNERP